MRDLKVLCVGHLPGLLADRSSVLMSDGHKVTLALNRHQAILTAAISAEFWCGSAEGFGLF
jgi:hypothetical protein